MPTWWHHIFLSSPLFYSVRCVYIFICIFLKNFSPSRLYTQSWGRATDAAWVHTARAHLYANHAQPFQGRDNEKKNVLTFASTHNTTQHILLRYKRVRV